MFVVQHKMGIIKISNHFIKYIEFDVILNRFAKQN